MATTKISSSLIDSGAINSSHLSNVTTAHLTEGSNLYHTTARARGVLSVTGGFLSYDSGTGVLAHDTTPTFVSIDSGNITSTGTINMNHDGATLFLGADIDMRMLHDGSNGTIRSDTGNLLLDVAGGITLDANGGQVDFKDNGVLKSLIDFTGNNVEIQSRVTDGDLLFRGQDGSSFITALTLDMSDAGSATFNNHVTIGGNLTVNGSTTTINSTTLEIDDLAITVAKGSGSSAAANGAGLLIDGPGASMTWDHGNQYFEFNQAVFSPIGFFVGTTGTKVGHLQNSAGTFLMEAQSTRQIAFGNETNGEFLRIDADGNVIQQNGTFTIKNASTDSNGLKISQQSSDESRIFNHYSGPLTFGTADTERMRIQSNGKVGIGTNNPTALLEISGKDDALGSTELLRLLFDNSPADTGMTMADINGTVKNRITMDSGNTGDLRISAGTQIGLYTNTTNGTGTPTVLIGNDGRLDVAKHIEVGSTTEDSSINGGLVLETPNYREYHFNWSGLTNHQVEMTCTSYFMAIVEYMSFQTNGGADIQEYHIGKWANNHTTHTWDEFESSGNTAAISATISAGQNNVSNSGKLTIAETYGSGSYSGSSLIVKVYFGDGGFAISKTT